MTRSIALLALLLATSAHALAEIDLGTLTSDLLATPPRTSEDEVAERRWTILPEAGYGADSGGLLGRSSRIVTSTGGAPPWTSRASTDLGYELASVTLPTHTSRASG